MNNIGSIGTAAIPIISSCLVMGAASSVMFNSSDELSIEAGQIVNKVLDDITNYLKIEDVLGKYYTQEDGCRIEKVVIQIKPLVKGSLDLSEMTIKLQNKDDLCILRYSGHASWIDIDPVFENQIWDQTNNSFSFIVIIDEDNSILEYGVLNEDTALIAIKLPDSFTLKDKESITITISPSKGVARTINLEAPSFHTSNIISFERI